MYPLFLRAGYLPELFWDLSYGEIEDILLAYQDRKMQEQEEELAKMKYLASVMWSHSIWISEIFAEKPSKKNMFDYFPELFKEEREALDKQEIEKQQQIHKAKMIEFANKHNKRNKEGV